MAMKITAVWCVLLPLLLLLLLLPPTHSESVQRTHRFAPPPSPYCQAPEKGSDGRQVVPPDFLPVCKRESEAERDKLTHGYEALLAHVAGLQSALGPVRKSIFQFLNAMEDPKFIQPIRTVPGYDERRRRILVAGIEVGRLHEAMVLYVTLGPNVRNDKSSIVERINKSPRRQQQHIENLIGFITILPVRQEQLEFFRLLRNHLVAHKDHEGYLGGLFASRARRVVFAEDGKTALNQTDERELWTTMVAAAAGHFKRSILAGKNVMDWYLLDRNHYDVLEMLLPKIFDASKEELRHLDVAKMIQVPCHMHRAHTKVLLFREILIMMQKHFTWDNQNFLHAPRIALAYHRCFGDFGNGPMSTKLKQEATELFKKFKKSETYETLLKTEQDKQKKLAG